MTTNDPKFPKRYRQDDRTTLYLAAVAAALAMLAPIAWASSDYTPFSSEHVRTEAPAAKHDKEAAPSFQS
jgi:hypothetical protein